MSILSPRPDGLGFYYGFIEGDSRQINVKYIMNSDAWFGYVGGNHVVTEGEFDDAEAAAIQWAKDNPEEGG